MDLNIIGSARTVYFVRDFEQCRQFYEQILGLEIDCEWDHRPDYTGHAYRGVVYRLCSTHLELLESSRNPSPDGAYLYIQVKDVDVLWGDMSKVARVLEPIASNPWGHRNFTIADPAGIRLKFYSQLAEADSDE
jgi:catechol 2,3-dioxygenase-like lactoylglutathione lyase family enzyme